MVISRICLIRLKLIKKKIPIKLSGSSLELILNFLNLVAEVRSISLFYYVYPENQPPTPSSLECSFCSKLRL